MKRDEFSSQLFLLRDCDVIESVLQEKENLTPVSRRKKYYKYLENKVWNFARTQGLDVLLVDYFEFDYFSGQYVLDGISRVSNVVDTLAFILFWIEKKKGGQKVIF